MNWETLVALCAILGTGISLHLHAHSSIQKQSERSDKLYEMFIDLLKSKKK